MRMQFLQVDIARWAQEKFRLIQLKENFAVSRILRDLKNFEKAASNFSSIKMRRRFLKDLFLGDVLYRQMYSQTSKNAMLYTEILQIKRKQSLNEYKKLLGENGSKDETFLKGWVEILERL